MIFDPAHKHNLDTEERRKILPPEEILQKSGLFLGAKLSDIGCGIGYFTIPAAKIVGTAGKIYACDLSDEMLIELRKRIEIEGLQNIELHKSEEYSIPLPNDLVDFLLLSNVLHEPDDRQKFLTEASRILRSGGRLILIDWLDKEMEQGPPLEERLSANQIENLLQKCGYIIIEKSIIAEKFHYYLAEKI